MNCIKFDTGHRCIIRLIMCARPTTVLSSWQFLSLSAFVVDVSLAGTSYKVLCQRLAPFHKKCCATLSSKSVSCSSLRLQGGMVVCIFKMNSSCERQVMNIRFVYRYILYPIFNLLSGTFRMFLQIQWKDLSTEKRCTTVWNVAVFA